MRRVIIGLSILVALIACGRHVLAQEPGNGPAEAYVWDLTGLYATPEAWGRAREQVLEDLGRIDALRGTLGDSPDALYTALSTISDLAREASRVSTYASISADIDLRDGALQERRQLAQVMSSRFSEATAWVQPEILSVGAEVINAYIDADERLARFAYQLENSLRNAPHTLGDEAEETLALFSQTINAPGNTYNIVANSDIPWPEIELATGETVRIDQPGYSRLRAGSNRDDRKRVFDAYWGKWREYRSSVGSVLANHIQTQVALARARNYDSVLQRELFQDNLPEAVYRTLVEEVNHALPTLHRYFRLRARMLGLEQMYYYDIYPPLVSLDKSFDIETTKQITLDAMSVLGDDWIEMQRDAIDRRWMHVYPQQGKRPGAYMHPGAYDVHPYVLLNHNDDYESLSTFAHEWGHAMHTLYARQAQPYETANYVIFLAEIPSTSLELILQDYMTANASSVDEQLFYLGFGLESMRGTFFRQTMFAEFELALYEAVERGEALSGDRISSIYGDIQKRYHGHDDGVVFIDELYTNEWMFVPHFYRNMYVFQYATSKTAGTALYAMIQEDREAGVENFKNLLRAGGSDYPYDILVRAGVDLADPAPYRAIVAKMNAMMDEMERLLDAGDRLRANR
jgi:oligoendopeptidase F